MKALAFPASGKLWLAPMLAGWCLSTPVLRADLVMENHFSDTNHAGTVILKLHGDQMRMDQPDEGLSVIVDLKTRDSFTLLTTNKTFLQRFGSEVRWQMAEERKHTGGTNEMDAAPRPSADTGTAAEISGRKTEIFTWSGARGLSEKLWVDTNFPNFNAIRSELLKLDMFNDTGPHRNAQPMISLLPGMVIQSQTTVAGRTMTNVLVSVKVGPVDSSLFKLPADYKPWQAPKKIHEK